ncbi:MAG: HAD family hydrolase [Candidatus Thorarchaeota archaeon]
MNEIEALIELWEIDNIIFDLDGTLVDTLNQHIKAFQILFQKLNLEIPYEKIAENMGRTPKDTLLSLLPDLKNDYNKLIRMANEKETILSTLLSEITIFDGAVDILTFLQNKKLPLCLASSTPEFNVVKILKESKLMTFFQVIVTGEDITRGKPDPEVFLVAARKAKRLPSKSLVIGDSPHDILAGKNAQMKVIAILTGKHQKKDILTCNPDRIYPSLKDLLRKM